jgi:hypothetical protein
MIRLWLPLLGVGLFVMGLMLSRYALSRVARRTWALVLGGLTLEAALLLGLGEMHVGPRQAEATGDHLTLTIDDFLPAGEGPPAAAGPPAGPKAVASPPAPREPSQAELALARAVVGMAREVDVGAMARKVAEVGKASDAAIRNGLGAAARSLGDWRKRLSMKGFFAIGGTEDLCVYVIDRSGSMEGTGWKLACKQLLDSLAEKADGSKFQVLFFNDKVTWLDKEGTWITKEPDTLDWVKARLKDIRPDSTTEPMPALRAALRLNPKTVYFLTDDDLYQSSPAQLEEIRKANRRARIHSILFASEVKSDSWAVRLSKENRGAFRLVKLSP